MGVTIRRRFSVKGRHRRPAPKGVKEESPGECELDLHLRAHAINFDREVELIPGRKWRVDFLVMPKTLKIVVEVDGATEFGLSRHSRGKGYEDDCKKLNALAIAGYRVMRFTTKMIASGEAISDILCAIGSTEA